MRGSRFGDTPIFCKVCFYTIYPYTRHPNLSFVKNVDFIFHASVNFGRSFKMWSKRGNL